MKQITRTKMTQIYTAVKRGDDLDVVAKKFGIPVERVCALAGVKPPKKAKAAKPKVDAPKEQAEADDTGDGTSAADDFK